MDYVCVGKLVNTHGIKGEVRIISRFRHKDLVFKPGFTFYVGRNKESFVVERYRVHKNFDMVTFKDKYDINLVERLKGSLVYVNKADIKLDKNDVLSVDLIGFSVIIGDKKRGIVKEVLDTNANEVLVLDTGVMIPYVKDFISKIKKEEKTIYVFDVKGLLS